MQTNNKSLGNSKSSTLYERYKNISGSTSPQNKINKNTNSSWNQFWGYDSGDYERSSFFEKMTPPEYTERKEFTKKAALETRSERVIFTIEQQRTLKEIEEIRSELAMLVKTVKDISLEVQKAVLEVPVKPGIYHIRFFERLKRILKLIRENLQDSRTWLRLSRSKKKQKTYWSLYRKKGTSFGLSGERTVSTQTG